MASLADQIVEGFKRDGWKSKPFDHFEALISGDPAELRRFVHLALDEWTVSSTFLDDAIAHIPEEELTVLARHAVEALAANPKHPGAADVIAELSLQCPRQMHPYLDRLFELRPNQHTYWSAWPWRESEDAHLEFLQEKASAGDKEDGQLAMEALLESRTDHALQFVLTQKGNPARGHFLHVGFELTGERFRRLHSEQSQHICLPEERDGSDLRTSHFTEDRKGNEGGLPRTI